MPNDELLPNPDTVSGRLQVIREALTGDNQTKFGKSIGCSKQQWNNYERGSPLPRDTAIRLVKTYPGLTLDYIFLGVMNGLTFEMHSKLASRLRELAGADNRAES